MSKKLFLSIFLLVVGLSTGYSQFLKPFDIVSKKKISYLTLEDGSEVEGKIKKIKYAKKGLIKEITLKVDGKKIKYPADKIKSAFFPQSAWDRYLKINDLLEDATQWDFEEENADFKNRLKDGYAFFEKIDIIIKGDERKLLMQCLNPYPGARIKVYHDPQARQKGGLKVGGIKVVKSQESNYYIAKDKKMAKRCRSKDYEKQFEELFGDCESVNTQYGKHKRWKKFQDAVMDYNKICAGE